MDKILTVNNLEVIYHRSIQALRGLSLSVPMGKIVALLGPNGAGKTTTLRAISGFLPLDHGRLVRGSIVFCGGDISHAVPHRVVRNGLIQVMEGRRVFEELSVAENLMVATYATAASRRHVIDEVFDFFPRLAERRSQRAGYLSGGEQQMLALGRALIARPKMMLLDEPSLGLAPKLVEEIFSTIQRINREQDVAILLVEQNAASALSIASYGYIIESGRIVADGSAEILLADEDIREFYLGLGASGRTRGYRHVKHYRRRKRWLS